MEIRWETLGTWMGAVMTPLAVFLAARLADGSAERVDQAQRRRKLAALVGLYTVAEHLALETVRAIDNAAVGDGQYKPPPPDRFNTILNALAEVPVLELYDYHTVEDLFGAQKWLAEVRDIAAAHQPGLSAAENRERCRLRMEAIRDAVRRLPKEVRSLPAPKET